MGSASAWFSGETAFEVHFWTGGYPFGLRPYVQELELVYRQVFFDLQLRFAISVV